MARRWTWVMAGLSAAFAAGVRLRLLGIPLERDEGMYAYMGRLMVEGVAPYRQAYDMKLPGVFAAYAGMMTLFGRSVQGIHLGLLFANLGAGVLLLLLVRKHAEDPAGPIAAAVYWVISLQPSVLGLAAHPEHFVMLFALAGLLLSERPFISGLLLGIAVLMKQHAAVFVLLPLAPLMMRRRWGPAAAMTCGAVVPLAATCLILLAAGAFPKFWFWTVVIPRDYLSNVSLRGGLGQLFYAGGKILGPAWLLGLLALAGLRHRGWLLAFAAASFLAICPGLYFREHYFMLLLPAAAALAGAAIGKVPMPWAAVLLSAALLQPVWSNRDYLFSMSPEQASRAAYGLNPFPESVKVAEYIRANGSPGDKVAVFGSEPQIYFLSGRRAATGHAWVYHLGQPHRFAKRLQAEMIDEVLAAKPEFVVLVTEKASWQATEDCEKGLFDWLDRYVPAEFERVGFVDILSPVETVYVWGAEARDYAPLSEHFMQVFRRKRL